jgi:hypothetical protein
MLHLSCSAFLEPVCSVFPFRWYRTTILDEPLLGVGVGGTDEDAI